MNHRLESARNLAARPTDVRVALSQAWCRGFFWTGQGVQGGRRWCTGSEPARYTGAHYTLLTNPRREFNSAERIIPTLRAGLSATDRSSAWRGKFRYP